MDYGHELEFGTFLTPVNDPPEAAVARAQLSEQLGFDLVTFQDHPYQSGFHDTWTLLTWVAAQTERIRLAGNVLNVPMRPAPVLARASASLDLLSGGRFELGLGAGGFWDAMAGMGVTRRTPGESVEQLGEAIDVMRELWRAGDRAATKYDGKYYQLKGAKRGAAAGARHPDLGGRLQAADAAAGGGEGGRMAALTVVPQARRPRAGQRHHRCGGQGGGS